MDEDGLWRCKECLYVTQNEEAWQAHRACAHLKRSKGIFGMIADQIEARERQELKQRPSWYAAFDSALREKPAWVIEEAWEALRERWRDDTDR